MSIQSNPTQPAATSVSGYTAYKKLIVSTRCAKAVIKGDNLKAMLVVKKEIFDNLKFVNDHKINLSVDSRADLAYLGIYSGKSECLNLPPDILGHANVPTQLRKKALTAMHDLNVKIAIMAPANKAVSVTRQEEVDEFGYKV